MEVALKKLISVLVAALLMMCGCGPQKNDDSAGERREDTSAETPVEDVGAAGDELPAEEVPVAEETSALSGKIICIDPGHCVFGSNYQEPVAPGSTVTKPAFVSGTSGAVYTEEQLNLIVGLKLEQRLAELGAEVLMTRRTAECELSNVGRAEFANKAGAALVVRLHADGSENSGVSGMSMLIPTGDHISDRELLDKSHRAGELILEQAALSTGAQNRGLSPRSDMTGFNWSTVPVVLLEMGFMTNPEEDAALSTEEYQDKIVDGIVNGLEMYFEEEEAAK